MNDLPRIRLRAPEKEDLPAFQRWRNEIMDVCREFRLINQEHQQRWWEGYCEQAFSPYPKHIYFAVERRLSGLPITKESWQLIGCVGWTYIDWLNKRAELSIYIGSEFATHRGYGRAALRELHRIGFEEYGFEAVWLEVHDHNERARKLFESEGYKLVGKWRDARFKDGKWHPTWIYDLTAEEYFEHST